MNEKPFWVCTNDHSNQGHHMYCGECGEKQAYPTCKKGHRVEWAGQMCNVCIREAEMSDKTWEVGKKYYLSDDQEVKVIDIDKEHGGASVVVRTLLGGVKFFNMNGEDTVNGFTLTTREVKEPNYTWLNLYSDGACMTYTSLERAEKVASGVERDTGIKCIGRKRINLNEIEGVWDD